MEKNNHDPISIFSVIAFPQYLPSKTIRPRQLKFSGRGGGGDEAKIFQKWLGGGGIKIFWVVPPKKFLPPSIFFPKHQKECKFTQIYALFLNAF